MVPEYLSTVLQVLDRGLKTNSYKFALLRALADHGTQDRPAGTVTFDWVAERFISYYWPLTVTFRVRQATDPTRDPVIMKFIRLEITELGMPPSTRLNEYRHAYADRYQALVARCSSPGGCFDEVIPRFHNVRGSGVPALLYECIGKQLHLQRDVPEFLADYQKTLRLLAIGAWVEFTEQFTFAPRLYQKIAGTPPERRHERYRRFLSQTQGTTCFYCGTETAGLHVDHVIPWSFVLEDCVWNLVLACQSCNTAKSDRTPDDRSMNKLIQRNASLLVALSAEGIARPVPAKRDLRGFTAAGLEAQITTLVENCRNEGFGSWSVPTASVNG
jgi:5-methylcytosine-specific restriction endonuclease McrA